MRAESEASCVNCRQRVEALAICRNCGLDPRIPQSATDQYLHQIRWDPPVVGPSQLIAVDGETSSLFLAVAITTGLVAIATPLLPIGVGIALALAVGAILQFRIRDARDRARLARIGPTIQPRVANIVKTACFRLDTPLVAVYVDGAYELNAYAVGFWGRHWIVMQAALFDVLADDELLFVIGHELGHIRRNHTTWLTVTAQHRAKNLPFISSLLGLVFNRWLLKAEYAADRAGLIACRDERAAVRALIRIHYWDTEVQVEELLKETSTQLTDPLLRLAEQFGSHPYLAHRIQRIRDFASYLKREGML